MNNLLKQIKTALERILPQPNTDAVTILLNADLLAENIKSDRMILLMPVKTVWTRTGKRHVRRELTVNVIFVAKNINIDLAVMDRLLHTIASDFLNNEIDEDDADYGGVFDGYSCFTAETVDNAYLGFVLEAFIETPSVYIGGLKLTFWSE
jgi:hypothetical protein